MAVAMLAVGIGINAAVFTVTNAVLFKGFPLVKENDRLVYLASRGPSSPPFVSYPDFQDWRDQARSFSGMAIVNGVRARVIGQDGVPQTLNATQVSADIFRILGVAPFVGRDFAAADETPGAAPVAILSHGFWERRYAKSPAAIGQALDVNGVPTTIVGVMPQGFSFPREQDFWLPLVPTPDLQKREARMLWFAFGRLADGTTIETARAELEGIGQRIASVYPATNKGLVPALRTFHEFFVGSAATTIYGAMMGAVGFVLLIACANLANLVLGRAVARTREVSVRIALGASRWQIVRQFLIESLLLSTLGGVLGWLIARWSVRAYELTAGGPGWFGRVLDYSMDVRVFVYLAAVAVGTGALFWVAPISRLARLDVNAALSDGSRSVTVGRPGKRAASALVMVEIALAVVLLGGAGVMIRSFLNMYNASLGMRTDNILATFVDLPATRYPTLDAQMAMYDRLRARLAGVPGVESVALVNRFPTQAALRIPYELEGQPPGDERQRPHLFGLVVGEDYFHTVSATVVSGRVFSDRDTNTSPPVVIVNQRFAEQHWPGDNPLGRRIQLFETGTPGAFRTVVGVVSNVIQNDVTRQAFDPMVYLPYRQRPAPSMWVFARIALPHQQVARAFRLEGRALDADLPFDPAPLDERLAEGYGNRWFLGCLFLLFAAVALLLAIVGLYGVVARMVGQRTQEIGVRTAMGATAADILRLIVRQAMTPVVIGLAIGLVATAVLTPVLKNQLVGVAPLDPVSLGISSVALLAAAILACVIPARRAIRVDTIVALRHD